MTPMQGPLQGSPVFAWADGPIAVLDPRHPHHRPRVRQHKIARALVPPTPKSQFTLVVEGQYRGFGSTSQIATAINDEYFATPAAEGMRIAKALDDRTIAVDIPQGEQPDPAPFIAGIMSTPIAVELLRLPAQVICDVRRGTISFTGDVRVSPVAVSSNGISIVSTMPPPVPTPADPLVRQTSWLRGSQPKPRLSPRHAPPGASRRVRPAQCSPGRADRHHRADPRPGPTPRPTDHQVAMQMGPRQPPRPAQALQHPDRPDRPGPRALRLLADHVDGRAPRPETPDATTDAHRDAAEQLVAAVLVEPILKQLRETSQAAPPFAPTDGEKQFRSMLDARLAHEITSGARFPLVDRLARDLRSHMRTEAQPPTAART